MKLIDFKLLTLNAQLLYCFFRRCFWCFAIETEIKGDSEDSPGENNSYPDDNAHKEREKYREEDKHGDLCIGLSIECLDLGKRIITGTEVEIFLIIKKITDNWSWSENLYTCNTNRRTSGDSDDRS